MSGTRWRLMMPADGGASPLTFGRSFRQTATAVYRFDHQPLRHGRATHPPSGMATPALIDDMGVDNVAFLIENLGADASELQYLRELVQNAFESIRRAGRGSEGLVQVDYKQIDGV